MPLSDKRDEAENRFKEAKRYSHPSKKEFDLEQVHQKTLKLCVTRQGRLSC